MSKLYDMNYTEEIGMAFIRLSEKEMQFNIRGKSSLNDLWSLPLKELDAHYSEMVEFLESKKARPSLLVKKSVKTQDELDMEAMLKVLEYIIKTRAARMEAAADAAAKRAKKQKLMEVYEQKQDEGLKNLTSEELLKMIDEL